MSILNATHVFKQKFDNYDLFFLMHQTNETKLLKNNVCFNKRYLTKILIFRRNIIKYDRMHKIEYKTHFRAKNTNKQQNFLVDEIGEFDIESSSDNDDIKSIYSIVSNNEGSTSQNSIIYTLMNNENECDHQWIQNKGNDHIPCVICYRYPEIIKKFQYGKCFIEICFFAQNDILI